MTLSENQIIIRDRAFQVYIPNEKIMQRIAEISRLLNNDLVDKNPVFIPVLNGAFAFAAELILHFETACEVDFVKTQSYEGTASTGNVRIEAHFKTDLTGKHLVIIEDIIDSGLTMQQFLVFIRKNYTPASIRVITLFDKPACREHQVDIYMAGFEIAPLFIVGFGLDYDGLGRNLPHIYQIVNP